MTELTGVNPENWAIWASLAMVGCIMLAVGLIGMIWREWEREVAERRRLDWSKIHKDSMVECSEVPLKDD